MKPLILLGNGPSLKNVDFDLLSNQDTFGMNGAFLQYERMNWYPKYYGMFIMGPMKWQWEEVQNFVRDNYLKVNRFFFDDRVKDKIGNIGDRITYIHKNLYETEYIYDTTRFSTPLEREIADFGIVDDPSHIKNYHDMVSKMFKTYPSDYINSLTNEGIAKLLQGLPVSESDKITPPRYKQYWVLPESFDKFWFTGGNTSYILALIGRIMGYKKVILLGMDCTWKVNDNNEVKTDQSYWFDDYFPSTYNVKDDFCKSCTPESLQRMHLNAWTSLSESIEANRLDFEIVNCTPNSPIKCFRQSTLEKEV